MSPTMHRGAGKIAARVLGEDTEANREVVYKWSSQKDGPFPIHKDGKTIFAWEHEIPGGLVSAAA